MISGFRHKVIENCALLGSYTACSDNILPTCRDKLLVPSSGFNNHFGFWKPENGTDRLSRNFGKKLPLLAAYFRKSPL